MLLRIAIIDLSKKSRLPQSGYSGYQDEYTYHYITVNISICPTVFFSRAFFASWTVLSFLLELFKFFPSQGVPNPSFHSYSCEREEKTHHPLSRLRKEVRK